MLVNKVLRAEQRGRCYIKGKKIMRKNHFLEGRGASLRLRC